MGGGEEEEDDQDSFVCADGYLSGGRRSSRQRAHWCAFSCTHGRLAGRAVAGGGGGPQ